MSEINVKVRMGTQTLYDTKVYIELEQNVSLLKKKICEKDESLDETKILAVYCGNVMEDSDPIYLYDVLEGATVHVFKQIKREKVEAPSSLSSVDLMKLNVALRSMTVSNSHRSALMKLTKPEVINNLILNTPGLSDDPVAVSLLQHPELLVKITDMNVVKRIAETHPALGMAILHIADTVNKELLKNHNPSDPSSVPLYNNISDEDIEELDESSESSNQTFSMNSSYVTITAAQLASAIASARNIRRLQPSTSGTSTSTENTESVPPEVINTVQTVQTNGTDVDNRLQIMRDMGLTNDAVNTEALRISSNLETAIELVLSGFTLPDDYMHT